MSTESDRRAETYDVVAELGRGAMGVVFLCRHTTLGRLVAIKKIAGGFATSSEARARLRREAQALGRLHHPNIVRVYDFVAHDDEALIIMQYVEGEDLRRLSARGALSVSASRRVLADIAAALVHAHSRDVVHRDVKPSNVLVTRDGHAVLGDFGLARLLAGSTGLRTRPGTVMGTPAYMAPEQILGEETDARTDAYAFAALSYELLVGKPAFEHAEPRALFDAHLHDAPVPPAQLVSGFPAAASESIMAGFAKSRDERASVAEMARTIAAGSDDAWPEVERRPHPHGTTIAPDQTIGGAALEQIVVPRHEPVASEPTAAVPVPVFAPPKPRRPAGRTLALVLGVALLAVAVAFAVIATTRHHSAFAVRDIRLTVAPATGSCPRATFTFVASVTGNRSGDVRVRWTRPDGTATPVETLRIGGGGAAARAVLRYTVSGSTATDVIASVVVVAPSASSTTSPPAHYLCH